MKKKMKSKRLVLTLVTTCLLVAGYRATPAQDSQEAPPKNPTAPSTQAAQFLVVRKDPVPMRMMSPSAEDLIRRVQEREKERRKRFAEVRTTEAGTVEEVRSGSTREIRVEPLPLVNPTPVFLFSDVTDRKPAVPSLTIQQRQVQVERFRQTLARLKRAESQSGSE